MSYYILKRQCLKFIETMIKKSSGGVEEDFIIYEVANRFGFGENLVKKNLVLLQKVGKIDKKMGVFVWK